MDSFRHRRTIPVVVRKDNNMDIITEFPVDLEEGDQFILCKEEKGWQAPRRVTISGYSEGGPIYSDKE